MVYEILGIKPLEGTSKKTGKPFDAYLLHCARENPNDSTLFGHEVKQLFVDKRFLLDDVKSLGSFAALVNMYVSVSYDSNGFIESCSLTSN